jgi:signal transduction histidine kinase
MKDLAMHLVDIIENSAKAGAAAARVTFHWKGTWLTVEVADDGPGLPPELAADPTDPYGTTRTERKVGLGLAFLRQSAEATGGRLEVETAPGKGVRLAATMDMASIDARPLGDLAGALQVAAVGWPELGLVVRLDGEPPMLDMKAVRQELDGIPASHPEVRKYLAECLEQGLAPLLRWAESVEVQTEQH